MLQFCGQNCVLRHKLWEWKGWVLVKNGGGGREAGGGRKLVNV